MKIQNVKMLIPFLKVGIDIHGKLFTLYLFRWKILCKGCIPYFSVFGSITKKKKKKTIFTDFFQLFFFFKKTTLSHNKLNKGS